MLRARPLSTHLPPFPPGSSPSATPSTSISENFSPQRSMFETNPETCFVNDLCPPTTTPLSPRIISICNPFSVNFLNISAHNEACLSLTLKHASSTTSVHPQLPPFSPGSSPSATPSTSIFLNISSHNEACFRLTLKHASYTTSVNPQLPPFPPVNAHLHPLQRQFSWIFQTTTKHVWD